MLRSLRQTTQTRTLFILISPIALGAVLAWQQSTTFHWNFFALTILCALSALLATCLTNASGAVQRDTNQPATSRATETAPTDIDVHTTMRVYHSQRPSRMLAITLYTIALLCGIVLTFFRPWSFAFGIAGGILIYCYKMHSIRLSHTDQGRSRLGFLCACGMLPFLSAYYVQAGNVPITAILAAIPIGLYATTVLYFQHFMHRQGHMVSNEIPNIAADEGYKARISGALLLAFISLALIANTFLGVFPWYSIIAILTVPPVLFALQQTTGDPRNYLTMVNRMAAANFRTTFLLLLALLIRGFSHL